MALTPAQEMRLERTLAHATVEQLETALFNFNLNDYICQKLKEEIRIRMEYAATRISRKIT